MRVGDNHFAADLSRWVLVGPQRGIVRWGGSQPKHFGKQAAMTGEVMTSTLPPHPHSRLSALHYIKLVFLFPFLQCVRRHGKSHTVTFVINPTIPAREMEGDWSDDALAVVVEVHHHAAKLVAIWRHEGPIWNDSIAYLDTGTSWSDGTSWDLKRRCLFSFHSQFFSDGLQLEFTSLVVNEQWPDTMRDPAKVIKCRLSGCSGD